MADATAYGTTPPPFSQQTTIGANNQLNLSYSDPNNVKLPNWLSTNPDDTMKELIGAYGNIQNTYNSTLANQVNARNNAISYQTSAGTQAANNAASEYAARAQQEGGSTLGAGVVKAQSMLPVYAANAGLRTEAADLAAKTHQEALGLSMQVGNTIAGLRQNYLKSLADFAQGQQSLQQQQNQMISSNWNQSQAAKAAAAQSLLAQKYTGPSGWVTNNAGNGIVTGQTQYNQYQQFQNTQAGALNTLKGML